MRLLDRLERKFGRYAIRNLTLYIAALNLLVFFLEIMGLNAISFLALNPHRIVQGLQIWRLVSFIFIPETMNLIWILFSVYLVYMIGASLERYWGTFKLNMYYLVGIIGCIVGAFITYLFLGFGSMTGYYLNMSLFLAYATLFPEQEFLLFFILPVKVKYLGILNAIFLLYSIVTAIGSGMWYQAVAILVTLINYMIFFGGDFIDWIKLKRKVAKNRKRFFSQVRPYDRDRR